MKKGGKYIGFLSNYICANKLYRDVAFVLISEQHRKKGFASLLAKYYAVDCNDHNLIPLYTEAQGEASPRVALNAGFEKMYSRIGADACRYNKN